jgi:hypothetical protein
MVPHVQGSSNCELGCFKNETKHFFLLKQPLFSGLKTAQAVDPLLLYRDFPGLAVCEKLQRYQKKKTFFVF